MSRQDTVPEKVQEAIFNDLLSRAENQECADCNAKSPTWVSIDFGVFLCIRCSGVHRQIGPHITRVRSTKLDSWKKENIEIIAALGNKIANDYYEYKMPSGLRKPTSMSTMEQCRRFVDDKYINKLFSPSGYPTPLEEYLANKDGKGNGNSLKNPQLIKEKSEPNPHISKSDNKVIVRKRSVSLESPKHKVKQVQSESKQSNHHHHVDLLSGGEDFFGSSNNNKLERKESHDGFGEFNQAKVQEPNFGEFKKSQNQSNQNQNTTQNVNFNDFFGTQNKQTTTSTNQSTNSFHSFGTTQNTQQQQQQTQQVQQQVQQQTTNNSNNTQTDLMKLYSQGSNNNSSNTNSAWDSLNFIGNGSGNQQFQQQQQQQQYNGNFNQGFNNGFNNGFNQNQYYNNSNGYNNNNGFNNNQNFNSNVNFQMGYNVNNSNNGYGQNNNFGNQGFNNQNNFGFQSGNNNNQFMGNNNFVSTQNKFF